MSLVQVTPTAGTPFSATVATFTDTDPATVDNYWATITWGDGSTSTVTSTASAAGQIVADPNGGFDVVASHTYQQYAASDTLSVLIDGTGRNGMELGSNITVADAPLIGGGPDPARRRGWDAVDQRAALPLQRRQSVCDGQQL